MPIPNELTTLAQWVIAGSDKQPLNPRSGHAASVIDPTTWGSYEEAEEARRRFRVPHIGFVFHSTNQLTFVDLDAPNTREQAERHQRIYEALPSYAELSQSRTGVHIYCRGFVPRGLKRDKVEIYSDARYAIVTGEPIRELPIVDCQQTLDVLFHEMGGNALEVEDLPSYEAVMTDDELVEMAMNAVDGDKFTALCRGEWEQLGYPSQSEADLALLSILAFYSSSNDQVIRLFRASALGKRDKAQRQDYLTRSLKRVRSSEPERIDFSALRFNGNGNHGNGSNHSPMIPETTQNRVPIRFSPPAQAAPQAMGTAVLHLDDDHPRREAPRLVGGSPFPPGLVGELARYIFESSQRPVADVGIAAALALSAGIVGRQYNISGTGLNLYLILLARTGVGKEGGPAGIDRLVRAVKSSVPLVDQFIGPAQFASGQAIVRALSKQTCFVSVLGEFGLTLQMLSDSKADALSLFKRRVLLDVYSKSGRSGTLRPTAYSDSEKNTDTVVSPSLTIFGESTPETYYAGLTQGMIADGLIPRFLTIEYTGDRPDRNPHAYFDPPAEVVHRLAEVVGIVLGMQANDSFVELQLEPGARALLDAFDDECDERIRSGGNDAIRQLWNRAHLKALRVAGVLAAMDRPHAGNVTAEEATWAIDIVRKDLLALTERFEKGDVGEGEAKQNAELERIIESYLDSEPADVEKYGATAEMLAKRVIPHVYMQRRTVNLSAFRKHAQGARVALKAAIEDLVRAGKLQEVPKQQMKAEFSTGATGYVIR